LDIDPGMSFGGVGNCDTPAASWDASAFGSLGLFESGTEVCPSDDLACCVEDSVCVVLSLSECALADGDPVFDMSSCDPNPCRIENGVKDVGAIKLLSD